MTNFAEQSGIRRTLLKEKLSEKNITYSALAKEIHVSLPTVKRWLSKGDMPMSGMEKILEVLGLTWIHFFSLIDKAEIKRRNLSPKQEDFLTLNPKATFVFLLLFHGYSPIEIGTVCGYAKTEVETLLIKLDKAGFIEYRDFNHLRVLVAGPFNFSETGPFSKKYFQPAARLAFEAISSKGRHFNTSFSANKPLVRLGEMYLSGKTQMRFKADLWELIEQYREKSRYESVSMEKEKLTPVTHLLLLDAFPLWKELLLKSD